MTEPERLTEADIEAMLAESGEDIAALGDDVNFRELVEAVGKELKRRLDEDPGSLPGTFLIKFFLDGQKAMAAGSVPDEVVDETVSILDRIDALPTEHACALLKGELARLDSLREDYFRVLERLQEGG